MKLSRLLTALLALAATAHTQSLPELQTFSGPPAPASYVDFKIVDLGDQDGDLIDDYGVIGATSFVHRSSTNLAVTLQDMPVPGIPRHASRIFALPDLEGDGFPEFAYVMHNIYPFTTNDTELRFASGLTAATLLTIPLPSAQGASYQSVRLAAIGDRDGDGATDFALTYVSRVTPTSPFWDTRIDIIDSATFTPTPLVTFPGVILPSGGLFLVGDMDGDGIGDFVSGSPMTSAIVSHGGNATVFSGADGSLLRNWLGQTAGELLGQSIVPLDDLDGDGLLEIAVYAPGAGTAGRVRFFSPGSGLLVGSINPAPGFDLLGLRAAGDLDGDGYRDVVIELQDQVLYTKHREVRSGIDGAFVTSIPSSAYPVGDLNGDDLSDLLDVVSTPSGGIVVHSYHGRTIMGAQSYGNGVGGRSLQWHPTPTAPATGILRFSGAGPSTPLLGAVSLQPAATTIFGTSFPLLISPAPNDLVATFDHVATAAGGHDEFIDLRVPALAGLVLYLQYAELGATPGTSNAVEMMFGPAP